MLDVFGSFLCRRESLSLLSDLLGARRGSVQGKEATRDAASHLRDHGYGLSKHVRRLDIKKERKVEIFLHFSYLDRENQSILCT